jgi:hypothetical protein
MTKPDDERPADKPLPDSGKVASTMLAALKAAYPHIAVHGPNGQEARIKVRAAIAQAEAAGIKED